MLLYQKSKRQSRYKRFKHKKCSISNLAWNQVQGSVNTLISAVNSITRSGSQLNIEQGFLEVGKKMTPFAHLSGSVVLFFKLNSRTDNTGNVESEVLALLNSRSTRLVTFELLKAETDLKSLKRLSMASNGAYLFATSSDYTNQVDAAINSTLSMAEEAKFQNRRITVTYSNSPLCL